MNTPSHNKGMHLSHTTQCKTCPWRVEASLEDIPRYSRAQLEDLEESCNQSGISSLSSHAMMCHHAKSNEFRPCLGWLVYAIGPGQNFGARMIANNIKNLGDVQLLGEQHETFQDTLREE